MRKFIFIVALLFSLVSMPLVAQEPTSTPTPEFTLTATPGGSLDQINEIDVNVGSEGNVEVTSSEETANYPVIDPAAIVATIVNAVSGLVLAAFGAAPVTVVIVALLKKIPSLDMISAPTMTFATASILYIGAIVASVTGYSLQFENFLEMVATVAPALVSFLATLVGAPKIFNAAYRNNVSVIGDSRTPPVTYVSDGNTIYQVQTDIPNAKVN